MNDRIEFFKNDIKNKKIAVLGLGISNKAVIKYLHKIGVQDITAFDRVNEDLAKEIIRYFEEAGIFIKYEFGNDYLKRLANHFFDYIFKTPVIRFDIPELVEARSKGTIVTSEMEIFMELCPAKTIAVTGSDGKTTTTTLIYNMLLEQGYKTWLGGNIGRPLINHIELIMPEDKVVLELSSFQLQTMSLSPDIAVITNISPNHLDIHKSYDEYINAKTNIFMYQNSALENFVVLNYDNCVTRNFANITSVENRLFSRVKELDRGAFIKGKMLFYRDSFKTIKIVNEDEVLLPGKHNVENCLAAIAAIIDIVEPDIIRKVVKNFGGVEHRLELVRSFEGVKYYNSSIDSSPSRTIAALQVFKNKIILIAGGKDKGILYDELGSHILEKVKVLILIGATSDKIENSLMNEVKRRGIDNPVCLIRCDTYKEVVETARKIAKNGDCVLLSPASTSFDMFKNFEERGNMFKKIVNELQ